MLNKLLSLFLVNFFLFAGSSFSLQSQGSYQWSPPQTIPGYDPETWPPVLIADKNRTIHAITSQWIDEDKGNPRMVIMYNSFSPENGWTEPVDILLSPIKNAAQRPRAFLDHNGMMHVVFFGGDNLEANYYYSRAPAAEAGNAQAWSPPKIIAAKALDPGDTAFFAEDSQHFGLLFSGKKNGNGLYAIYSGDAGDTWSDPELIFPMNNDQLYPYNINVYLGQSGVLHAVWSIWDQSGNGLSVFYANYDLAKKIWSDPIRLTSEGRSGFSDVIEYDDRVVVTYSDYTSNAFWMRESNDGGRTWADPVRIAPRHIGRNGVTSFVIDSSNTLHFFFAERITGTGGNPDIHGMWHTTWENDHWTEPEAIVSGPRVEDRVGDKGFDPLEARAVVSQGNLIMVTWRTENQSKGNGVWYSYKKVDAPELPIEVLPSQSIKDIPTSEPTGISPTFAISPVPEIVSTQNANLGTTPEFSTSAIRSPNNSLGLGLIPLVILLSIAVISIQYQRNRR